MSLVILLPMVKTNGVWTGDADTIELAAALRAHARPIKLMVSLAGHCNLNCFHCSGPLKDPKSASHELIDFIVDKLVPHVRAIRLGGRPKVVEPLTVAQIYRVQWKRRNKRRD